MEILIFFTTFIIVHFFLINQPLSVVYFRLSKYLVTNEKENEEKHIERLGQFDVAYHNISFDNDEESKEYWTVKTVFSVYINDTISFNRAF